MRDPETYLVLIVGNYNGYEVYGVTQLTVQLYRHHCGYLQRYQHLPFYLILNH